MKKIKPGELLLLHPPESFRDLQDGIRKMTTHYNSLKREIANASVGRYETAYQSYLRDFPNSNLKPYIK